MKAANTNQILDHSILFVTSDLRLTKRLGVPKSKMLPNITRYWKIPHLKIYYLISLTVYIKIINGEMLYIISEVREQHIIHNDWLLIAPGQRLVWYYWEGLVELVADFCFLDSASSSVLSTGVFSFIKKTIISADMRHITEETAAKYEKIILHSC